MILDFFLKLLQKPVVEAINWLWGTIIGQTVRGGAGEFGCKYAG
jgi:hypothetical protein